MRIRDLHTWMEFRLPFPFVFRLLPAGVRVVAGFDAEEDGALPYESS